MRLFDHDDPLREPAARRVCADSLEIAAARACTPIVSSRRRSTPVVTREQALAADAPRVRADTATLPRTRREITSRGDVDAGLRDADVTITREYRTPVALHTALEPHGAVAEWSGGRLTVWESTQGIFMTRREVAKAFGLPLIDVRVIKNYMGGGFGAKNGAPHADVRRRRARES